MALHLHLFHSKMADDGKPSTQINSRYIQPFEKRPHIYVEPTTSSTIEHLPIEVKCVAGIFPFDTEEKQGCGRVFYASPSKYNLFDWVYGVLNAQQAFPSATPDDRELLMTGTCGECWDKLFGEEEGDTR